MRVLFRDGKYICRCTFDDRGHAKNAGFRWDGEEKEWYTLSHQVAARLRSFADESAKAEIRKHSLTNTPWAGDLVYPEGKTPFPFQLDATRFALARSKSYLALDPGLGKTIIAGLVVNALKWPAVYICPPFLTRNTAFEVSEWTGHQPFFYRQAPVLLRTEQVFIMPDSLLFTQEGKIAVASFARAQQHKHNKVVLFVDEAHRFKSDTAKRTKALFALTPLFDKVVFLSGTPMPNRPMELYPVLSNCAPETIDFKNKFQFGERYCAAYRDQFGWNFSGASNVAELAKKVMGTFMMRVRKADVLKDLPEKSEELVFIGDELPARIAKMDTTLLRDFSPEDLMKGQVPSTYMATYRKELGIVKVKESLKYIQYLLDEHTDESILVFAQHREVIRLLVEGLMEYAPAVIVGDTPMAMRQDIVTDFQKDPKRRVFIGNIAAAGTGFTLTKATRVVFVESSWCDADNQQASDRAHRISQKDFVFVQYLVYKNSIDRQVMETIFRKRKITGALDAVR